MMMKINDEEFLDYVENHVRFGNGTFTFETLDRLHNLADIYHRYDEEYTSMSNMSDSIHALVLKARVLHLNDLYELTHLYRSLKESK